jgi:membrane fusion protein
MNAPSPLFRSEAIAAAKADHLGRIVLSTPASFTVLSALFGVAACVLVAFLFVGEYTAHSTLRGRLVPDRGVIDVHSPQFGTVVEQHVMEGQSVARGDVLYVVSSDRVTSSNGATQLAVAEQLVHRRRSLVEQIENTRALEHMERESLGEALAALNAEVAQIEQTVAGQADRVRLAQEALERYERVRAQGFVSDEQLSSRRIDLLEQRARLQGLERELSGSKRELTELGARASGLQLRYASQTSDLERTVASVDLEIAENEARRGIVVTAPEEGIATGVAAHVGQAVDSTAPLVLIVPADSKLRAEFYAPSRAVGFVAVGDEVLLRYEPYPYQKFGHYRGTVAAVSQTALQRSAVGSPNAAFASDAVYEVLVTLQEQTVLAYGERRELRSGMVVEADVLLETRRLYEWVLEPLYSLTGKVE